MQEQTEKVDITKHRSGSWIPFFVILIFLCGFLYFALACHIVSTSAGIKIYPKRELTLKDTYVDMTRLSFIDLRRHTSVVSVMAEHNDLEYVPGGTSLLKFKQAGRNVTDAVNRFDNEYQISNSAKEIGRISRRKYEELDERYDIEGKTERAREAVKGGARRFNEWLKNR
ncbi:MAG: hypothetical protein ABIH64_03910 [Nanoarchaeota archaeon]